MRKLLECLCLVLCLVSCGKNDERRPEKTEKKTHEEIKITNPVSVPVEVLTIDGLVGNWLLLDSEGEIDGSGDYLLIERDSLTYKGLLMYQKYSRPCKLIYENDKYYIISEKGEKYKISRSRSTHGKAYNGIWLALDDIDLGVFQRADILKNMQGE
jgi:hypothetical protein